jgi:hypothetical protein
MEHRGTAQKLSPENVVAASTPRSSQHLPGREIPEDFWFYRLKKNVFFKMGGAL